MSEHICPICQRPNDPSAERCWYCQAVLTQIEKPENSPSDWLDDFREDSEQPTEPEQAESAAPVNEEPNEEVPDWLARIRTREQQERESLSAEKAEPEATEERQDLPDWLKEIKAGNSGKKAEPANPPPAPEPAPFFGPVQEEPGPVESSVPNGEDDTQEWLERLAAWKPSEGSQTEPETGSHLTPEQPSEEGKQTPFTEQYEPAAQELGLDPTKGWQKLPLDEPEAVPEVPFSAEPQKEQPIEPTEEAVDLFKEPAFEFESLEPVSRLDNQPAEESASSEEDPNRWMDDLLSDKLFESGPPFEITESTENSESPSADENPQAIPFVSDDLPDWLSSASLEKSAKKPDEAVSEELNASSLDADLEKANLPPWLQAMRPSSEPTPTQSTDGSTPIIEGLGMLAGIDGVLRSQELSEGFHKPVGYGSALKVSEHQKANANLFSSLVEESLEIQDIVETPKRRLKPVLWKSLLALALLTLIFFSKDFLGNLTVQPALFPPEVVASYDMVNTLPVDKPVLLVSEFEPAAAGELSWSSQTLLEHLLRRDLNIAILSNNPAGTTILTQFLADAGQKISSYDLTTRAVNLGYLPGGTTGLLFLTQNLRSAMPYTHDFLVAWDSPVLQSVNALSDFGAIIVISDKAESARIWIEQVQPALTETPLVFVISAQAAPMLSPYYQSGQVTGYIGGFNGSLAYESLFQQPSVASEHLTAFQSSLLFVAILIFLGGLITLIHPPVSTQKGKR